MVPQECEDRHCAERLDHHIIEKTSGAGGLWPHIDKERLVAGLVHWHHLDVRHLFEQVERAIFEASRLGERELRGG